MDTTKLLPDDWRWLIEISIGLSVIVILSFVLRKSVQAIRSHIKQQEGATWQRKLHKILHMPLQVAVWGFGLAYVLDILATHFGFEDFASYVKPLKKAFIVSCFGWIALRWVKEVFRHLAKRSEKLGIAAGTIYALSKLSTFLVSIIILMIIFQVFNLNIAPLLAFGGIGVAGFAFAAQDMIANFFGGAMLHLTRVFVVGDQITIPSRENFRGIVKEIGWYITLIMDFDRRPVYFPNALFTKAQVINDSRRTHRRIKETITIRYQDSPNLEKIIEEMREKVASHPQVDEKQSYAISFTKFGDHGLEIYIYLLVNKMPYIQFLSVQQEVFLIIQEVVYKYGAEFCYPTTSVLLSQQPSQQ